MNDQMTQALQKIKNQPNGDFILNNPKPFKSAIEDVLPGSDSDMVRMRRRLVEAHELGTYTRLSKAATANALSQATYNEVEKLREYGIDEAMAERLLARLWRCLERFLCSLMEIVSAVILLATLLTEGSPL